MSSTVKRMFFKVLSKSAKASFRAMSHMPLVGRFGKTMYAAGLFGEASGLYFKQKYVAAIDVYNRALDYSQGMEEEPPIGFSIEQAYKALGEMYEKGLGVDKDELKAEECYLC